MKKIFLILLLLLTGKNFGQDTIIQKSNPIVYGELLFGFGGSFNKYNGYIYGGSLGYQIKKNLFTIRYTVNPEIKYKAATAGLVGVPVFYSRYKNKEIGLLYGRRFVKEGRSLSFAAGISTNELEYRYRHEGSEIQSTIKHYYGMAYELNIKWFKHRKERYRIYGMFPVGKPTAFGRSIGLKLTGNISKHSYLGFGITYGFGLHKHY